MQQVRITNTSAITGFSFVAMFFLGLGVAIVGAGARNVGISAEQIGILMTAQFLGFFLSVAFTGYLADRYPKPLVLAAGSVAVAIGFGGFFLWQPFVLNAGFMLLIGIGIGTYEGVTDTLLLELHPARTSLFVNLNHFFVTLGSLMITAYLMFLQMAWRVSMNQATIVVAILALLFAGSRVPRTAVPSAAQQAEPLPETDRPSSGVLRTVLRTRAMLFLTLAMICAVGLELGSIAILTTYLMELRDFDQLTSKLGLLLLIAGFGVGRAVLGALIRNERERVWILCCFTASAVATLLLYNVRATVLLYVLSFGAGFVMSVLLPTIIALAGKRFPDHAGTAIGLIKMGIPVGGMLLPLLLSGVTAAFSLQVGLLVFPLSAAVGAGAIVALRPVAIRG